MRIYYKTMKIGMQIKMDKGKGKRKKVLEEEEQFFLLGKGTVWSQENDQLLSTKDPIRKKNLKSIAITLSANDKDRFKLVFLNQDSPVLDDKDPAVTHLAYYVDCYSTVSESEISLFFPSYKKHTNYIDCNGLSNFHMACANGDLKIVKQFLDNGEDVHCRFISESNSDRRHKFTALHFAVAHHNTEVVQLLLEHGADVDAIDALGMTPVHLACAVSWDFKKSKVCYVMGQSTFRAADLEILQLLIVYNCDLSLKDHNGDTPLLSIFKNDYFSPLRVNEIMSIDLYAIDRLASFLQIKQLMKFQMLFEQGIDINSKNYNNDSILHCVIEDLTSRRFAPSSKSECDRTYAEVVQVLLKDDALDVNAKNKKGETPLALAVSILSYDIVEILLEHKADPSSLRIDGHRFFRYPNVPLTEDLMINFEKIMSSLTSMGYKLPLEQNLVIMKFFMHDVDDCDCGLLESLDEKLRLSSQLIFFGSLAHMKRVLRKTVESPNLLLRQFPLTSIGLVAEYCRLISYPFIMDIESLIKPNIGARVGLHQLVVAKYQKHVNLMKSMKLSNGLSLYDIMRGFPSIVDIPRYLQYDDEEFELEILIGLSISDHLKKLRVRMYIGSSASDNYMNLLLPFLPSKCRIMILDYLANEDILKLCAAALLK